MKCWGLACLLGAFLMVGFALNEKAFAVNPDYSGTWIANVKRIGADTCRKNSRKRLRLTVAVQNVSANRIAGVITGNGKPIYGTGTPFSAAFNIWKVTWTQSKKYGNCTTQEGIYIPQINLSAMTSKKVNFNHNVNCHKGANSQARHTYSCHYTYKGSAARVS